jgi:hypothetical protein
MHQQQHLLQLTFKTYHSFQDTATMSGFTDYPPFPEDVPTHPLLVIDYALIKQRDEAEVNKLWEAATQLGFW